MTGKRLGDGTVLLASDAAREMSDRMAKVGKPWPWCPIGVTVGDTRVGISWPMSEERAAGIYKPGCAVLCVQDASGVLYVLRSWPFYVIKDAIRPIDAGVEVVNGLRGAVAECMLCGITHFAVQSDKQDMARSYMQQLFADVPGADRMVYDRMADIASFCARLAGRAEVGQIVQTREIVKQIADDRQELNGKPGPLEIAIAVCAASYDYNALRKPQDHGEFASLYPLPKGAKVFGG